MPPRKIHKLYCYLDETGQDTVGELFIVAVVVTDNRQHELEALLENIESRANKKFKWAKARDSIRQAYISELLKHELPATIFVKKYIATDAGRFDELEVVAVAQALAAYRGERNIGEKDYKLTLTVDGLSKTTAARMAGELRRLGIQTRKIVGKRDESSAIIRLADAIAGLAREAHERRSAYQVLVAQLKRTKQFREL